MICSVCSDCMYEKVYHRMIMIRILLSNCYFRFISFENIWIFKHLREQNKLEKLGHRLSIWGQEYVMHYFCSGENKKYIQLWICISYITCITPQILSIFLQNRKGRCQVIIRFVRQMRHLYQQRLLEENSAKLASVDTKYDKFANSGRVSNSLPAHKALSLAPQHTHNIPAIS